VPAPAYPLLAFLAELEEVRLVAYPLLRDEGWRVDLAAVERALGGGARAIVLVHPGNPTGAFPRRADATALGRLCRAFDAALIAGSDLSVATPVQLALPEILRAAPLLQERARARIAENLAALDGAVAARGPDCALRRLPADGGWYALMQLPRTRSDDAWLEAT